jgi:hypothetical protein
VVVEQVRYPRRELLELVDDLLQDVGDVIDFGVGRLLVIDDVDAVGPALEGALLHQSWDECFRDLSTPRSPEWGEETCIQIPNHRRLPLNT